MPFENPFLTDDQQAPEVNPLATQTGMPAALQQALNTRQPNPTGPDLHKPGVVKKFFVGYLDNMTRALTGQPSSYEEELANKKLKLQEGQQQIQLMNQQSIEADRKFRQNIAEQGIEKKESPQEAIVRRIGEAQQFKLSGDEAKQYILNGKIPEKKQDMNISEGDLAMQAAGGDPVKALKLMAEQKKAGRSVINAGGALTDDALDMAAEMYRKTGIIASLGMGAAGDRKAILNRAARMGKVDVAANKADYAANQSSLNQITKSLDAVTAFESTAAKNLDVFTAQAKKVVDSGAPWINKPLRSLDMGGMGSEDVAAYKAARQVALTEVARVVSNPNLVGVLSDQARQEIAEFNPESATLKQTLRVVEILKQDMKNRKDGLSNQRREIQGRISGQQSGADTVIVVDPQGKPWTVPKTNLQKLLVDHPDFKVQSNGR